MTTNGQDEIPAEKPKLEIIAYRNGGCIIGVNDEDGAWPFQSEIFDSWEEAERRLSQLNTPLPYEALCTDCKAGYTEQDFMRLEAVSGLWACPCSKNSLLFPSSQTVEESIKKIQEFMQQRGD